MQIDNIYTQYISYLKEKQIPYTAHHSLTVQLDDVFIRIMQQEDHLYIWGYIGNLYTDEEDVRSFTSTLEQSFPEYVFPVYNDPSDTCAEIDMARKFGYTTPEELHSRVTALSDAVRACAQKAAETFGERFSRPEAAAQKKED